MLTDPIPSASVLLLRDQPLEVLMILRHESSSFVPSAWVFPGGAVEPQDGPPDEAETLRRTAVREVLEETGIPLTGELVWTSRWITPAGMPKRFDTWFFLAPAGRDLPVRLQQSEAADFRWIEPAAALRAHAAGGFPMVFPTVKNLEAIAGYTSRAELLESRRGAKIEAVQPVLIVEGTRKKIVLP
ncbi:MAG TPA: NUDIX hydrolase [Thermoanaerobaculia bacterium]|nr:NUDIX hydrolase [Thermoanaerobaculia bacterium]